MVPGNQFSYAQRKDMLTLSHSGLELYWLTYR